MNDGIDHAVQSAVNTLRNWRMRQEASGRIVTRETARRRLEAIPVARDEATIERIIDKAMA
jgi:hypothetical protein